MKIGTDREEHKLGTIINTNGDIIILIDHHLDTQKLASFKKNNRIRFMCKHTYKFGHECIHNNVR